MAGQQQGVPVNYKNKFNIYTRFTFIEAADCNGFFIAACHIVFHTYREKEEDAPLDTENFL